MSAAALELPVRKIFDPKQPAIAKELDRVDDDLMACVRRASMRGYPSSEQCRYVHRNMFMHQTSYLHTPALFAALRTKLEIKGCAEMRVATDKDRVFFGMPDIRYPDALGNERRWTIEAYGDCVAAKAYGSAHIDKTELDDCRSELARCVNKVLTERHTVELAEWERMQRLASVAATRQLPPLPKTGSAVAAGQLLITQKTGYSEQTIVDRIKDSWGW